jgi:aspartate/methionine/tyrosine aminotransferase
MSTKTGFPSLGTKVYLTSEHSSDMIPIYLILRFVIMKFLDNDWEWDVRKTPPFLAFRTLRRRAANIHGEANVLDISQGEPGYGFAPSARSRRFFSYLLIIDTVLNNNQTDDHFGRRTEEDFPEIEKKVQDIAREYYSPDKAEELIEDMEEFLSRLEEITTRQGHPKNRFEILFDIFKFSIVSGGRYPNSWGELLVRMAIAEERSEEFGFPVSFEDIITVNGASHGVGMFFKGLGEEGIGFLKEGDTVLMVSPVYAPYTQLIEDRGLKLVNISIDAQTGILDEKSFQLASSHNERIKAIILIDPNNPTGFPLDKGTLEKITDIAEKNNSIILSDEVYSQFFSEKESIVSIEEAKKRTIRLNALSKIERSTGVRLGDVYLAPEAKEFITHEILEPECPGFTEKYSDIRWFLFLSKSVGGGTIGVFQHISGTPGPSQILGLCHILLGKKERKEYVEKLHEKVNVFYEALGLPQPKNNYYGIVDIRTLEGPETAKKSIEQILTEIAEKGVIVMPAYKFFSEADREKDDRTKFIRASLPNLSTEDTKKAGKIIREHISQ